MQQTTVEQLGVEDLHQVQRFQREAENVPRWSPEVWADVLSTRREGAPERRVFGLKEPAAEELAGLIVVSRLAATMEIEWLLVRAERRRKGFGGLLVRHALAWGQGHAVREVLLEVRAANAAAQGMYAQLGFEVSGRRPRYYRSPEEDAILMRSVLGDTAVV